MPMSPVDDDRLLTLNEAAATLRASRSKVYRLLKSGDLRGHKVGNTWLFYESEIHAFVAECLVLPVAGDTGGGPRMAIVHDAESSMDLGRDG